MTKTINEYAETHNIFIDNFKMEHASAFCVEYNNQYYIAVDERKFETEKELNTAKLHELGHCETGALYTVNSPLWLRDKCEYKADKWAITHFIDKGRLEHYLKQNVPIWEISEIMGVTEKMLNKACVLYFNCPA